MDVLMAFSADDADHKLVAAAQQGERSALDLLVRRHDCWVRRVMYANVGNATFVDDIVQTVWSTVWKQIGTLADRERWRGWLYRLAKNAAIDAGQKAHRERRRRVPLLDDSAVAGRHSGPIEHIGKSERRKRVLDAIEGLPAIYREPFVLRHMEDWNYAKIGEVLSLKLDTVETRLVRARRLLRDALRDEAP